MTINYNEALERHASMWYRTMQGEMKKKNVQFSIDGNTITCTGFQKGNWPVSGIYTFDTNNMSPTAGMMYAYARAYKLEDLLDFVYN